MEVRWFRSSKLLKPLSSCAAKRRRAGLGQCILGPQVSVCWTLIIFACQFGF